MRAAAGRGPLLHGGTGPFKRVANVRSVVWSVDVALGAALVDCADAYADPARRITEIRRIVDASAVPRARLWDVFLASRADFEAALAERMGLDRSDRSVQVTAGIALDVFAQVDEQWKGDHGKDYRALITDAIRSLPTATIILPSLGPVGQ